MSNLKRIRTDSGLSQTELAEHSGVNVRMIQHYEQGIKDINKAQAITIHKLAQALKCNMEDLLEIEYKSTRQLTNKELADIFSYCGNLSRMVSPNDAKKYYGFTFDGAISDTLYGLAVMYEHNESIDDFKSDEFYGPVLERIFSDINDLSE